MKVFSYWEGPMPEYIKICIQTMERNCDRFTLLTPENIEQHLSYSPLNIEACKMLRKPAHRADCYRVAIIHLNGGLWLDCDTVVISGLNSFKKTVSPYRDAFFYSKWNDGRVLNGYFYATKNNNLLGEWLNGINKALSKKGNSQWTRFGEAILTPLIKSNRFNAVSIDRRIFLPINVDRIPWVFFEPVHWSSFVTQGTVAIGLNHSWFCDHVPTFVNSRKPWDGSGLIHQLINEMR